MKLKQFLLSAAILVAFGIASFRQHVSGDTLSDLPSVPTPTPQNGEPTPAETANPEPLTPTPPPVTPTPQSEGHAGFKDGEYTGNTVDAFYGNVQVKAVIQNGKLTDVQFLQYPNDRQRSLMISRMSLPMLRDEAIQAQSGQVDIVSGATDTSQAFIESLSSALARAQ